MNCYADKISILSQMISFALVDDELHEEELKFLKLVSEELGVKNEDFIELFFNKSKNPIIKEQFMRILHFYQLAILMYSDNKVHFKEKITLNEIGIKLGLCPNSMTQVLELMHNSDDRKVPIDVLISIFQQQYN